MSSDAPLRPPPLHPAVSVHVAVLHRGTGSSACAPAPSPDDPPSTAARVAPCKADATTARTPAAHAAAHAAAAHAAAALQTPAPLLVTPLGGAALGMDMEPSCVDSVSR